MLNPFPILYLALFGYFFLRLGVGGVLLYLGIRHLQYRKRLSRALVVRWFPYGKFTTWVFGVGEIIIGVLFVLGLFTQFAAILSMLMSLKLIILRRWFKSPDIPGRLFYVLLLAASLSLLVTGAGAFAFDLPI